MPSGSRVRLATVGLGLILALGVVAPLDAQVTSSRSSGSAKTIYYKNRSFRIPVTIQQEVRSLVREVRLWVSDDFGYHWKELGQTSPDRPEFPFRATRDAEYWFALQTIDTRGKVYPSDDRQVEPSLKVVVDTAPPTIVLEPGGRRGSQAAVRWEVQDEHLVLKSLVLEYQTEGAGPLDWRSVPLRDSDYKLIGVKSWDVSTSDPIRVRASIKDRANNVRQVEVVLPDGAATEPGAVADLRDFNAPPPVAPISSRSNGGRGRFEDEDPFASIDNPPPTAAQPPAGDFGPASVATPSRSPAAPQPPPSTTSADQTLLVGSPKFPLQYAVEDANPNAVARVELWVSHDGGRTWYPQPEDPDRVSPYMVDLGGEGTFGLWLSVQGISGLGDPPPAPGDRPQMWVEVDSTPPVVQVDPPRIGTGQNAGKVLITWRGSDPHLAPRPVTILYQPEGSNAPWTPLAQGLDNTGQYIWSVPPGAPPRFRIRVEVSDTLGHRGSAETGPIVVDRTRPRGRILGLDPSARLGEANPRRY